MKEKYKRKKEWHVATKPLKFILYNMAAVLRIRILDDPVLFDPWNPGWGKNPDPGRTSQIIF